MTSIRDRLEEQLSRVASGVGPNVFTVLYPEAARAAADAADARARLGISLGPLDGVLVSIKDLFDVAGEVTFAGSALRRNAPPATADALVVRRLRRAGAVIFAKTNMSEFAFSGLGLNPHHGTPGNAADPSRVPGGSSSGAGVSVGQGTSAISIGTDTGGSVRIPAALNGVVGFKPTARRVPLQGAFPLSYALDSIGPLARSVAECAAADAVLAGEEPEVLEAFPVAGLRVGVPRGRLLEELEPEVETAFDATLRRLAAAGARIVDHSIEDLLDGLLEVNAKAPLVAVEAAEVHMDWFEDHGGAFDPNVRARIALGGGVSAQAYLRSLRRRTELIAAVDQRLATIDVLALPTTATTAPLIAPLEGDPVAFVKANMLMLRNPAMGNLFDLTGLSLPMPEAVRPAGLMLLAPHGADRRLLAIGAGVEAALA
jgi:aspartyl-tRNA(Asn)/glutamyl-tRNA(Gln) amidotransferase subunit A